VIGIAGAMTADAAFLGGAEPARPAPSWAPTVGATHNSISLGLAGTF